MRTSSKKKIAGLILLFLAAVLLGVGKGSVGLSPAQLLSPENRPLLFLRLLRVLAGVVTGGGLAVCGIVLQSILRNPLAEPYLLGTSTGAGLGAVAAVLVGWGAGAQPLAAFLGAVLSAALVYVVARQGNGVSAPSLILSGVVVSVALSGIMVFLVTLSPNEAIHGLLWWLWGSLDVGNPRLLLGISGVVLVGAGFVYVFSQDLNALSLGEEEAHHLGVKTEAIKTALFLAVSLMTACLVCLTGIIGFVGLIIPHMMRLVVGPNHKILIPSSFLAGAAFLVACDALGRTVFSPMEIPIGVVTALAGAPMFIFLMKVRGRAP